MHQKSFTVEEANALVPLLERVFLEIERRMEAIRKTAEQLQVLEVLWGDRVLEEENPDHAEAERLRLRFAALIAEIEEVVEREIDGRGLRFPEGGLEHGLIDFPTTWAGRWVYLCWRRGESEIQAWHELTGGFAGRRQLSFEHARRMGRKSPPERDDLRLDE